VTADLVRRVEAAELEKIRSGVGAAAYEGGRFREAQALFEQVALGDDYPEFLTLPAYERLE
jgi:malate synthase